MYYVITKGGERGSAKCLLLLTWGGVNSLIFKTRLRNMYMDVPFQKKGVEFVS